MPAPATLSISSVAGVGKVLVNGSGHTLYLFTPEKGGKVACTGSCTTIWPPVVSSSSSASSLAGSGLKASDLATVSLGNGAFEVTYFGWPLHTYSGDSAPGVANGQGIGGQWFAVTAAGKAAGKAGSSPSGSDSAGGGSSGGGY